MITQDAFTLGKSLILTILAKMDKVNKSRQRFIVEVLLLFLSHRGRMNFLQMERQGNKNEKSYRYQFEKPFNWMKFNTNLIKSSCSNELIIGFDPSYITKSGKCSPGLGYFYSGCAGQYKRGLEIGNFAVIDIRQNTAYHLEATQSPSAKRDRINKNKTLVDYYSELVASKASQLQQVSTVLVCDAYFGKKKFVDKICDHTELELISRLRDDANLRYLYTGKRKGGKGRPRKYSGKVDVKNIDNRKIKLSYESEGIKIYSAVVHSIGLDRKIKLCYVEFTNENGKIITKLFFSTNLERAAEQILKYYQARYQMEFVFRDAKQYTGLEQCQARNENKLDFHFNASLSAISIAKVIARHGINENESIPISVANIKIELQNRNMIYRIFSIYGFNHKLIKINQFYKQVLNLGKIAA